jgi:hypothetical protein
VGPRLLALAPGGNRVQLTEGERFDARISGYGMSEIARLFVERHRLSRVNATKGNVLNVLANQADDTGRARMTQRDVEHRVTVTLITVKRAFISLQQAENGGPYLEKAKGRGWIILGVSDHDGRTCGDDECAAEARLAELPADVAKEAAKLARKRLKTAERVRRHRERQKAAQRAAQGD